MTDQSPQMGVYPARYRLPVAYSTEIGRIITRWAYLEWQLRETAYLLLEIDPQQGRIAVREPRADDYLIMIQDLMRLQRIHSLSTDMPALLKAIKAMRNHRDRVAHGVWIKHDTTKIPVLQVVAGSYPPKPGAKTVKARINPQGVQMSLQSLKEISASMTKISHAILQLNAQIDHALSTRRK